MTPRTRFRIVLRNDATYWLAFDNGKRQIFLYPIARVGDRVSLRGERNLNV